MGFIVLRTYRWHVVLGLIIGFFTFDLQASDWRTFGFYKGYSQSFRSTLFNPDHRIVRVLGYTKGPHTSLAQSIRGRWDFLSLQWQAEVMGRADHVNEWDADLEVKQFCFQKDLFENWILVAGRSIQRWGTGYAFNPTDVAAPSKEISDPDNSERRAAGADIIQLEYFNETTSFAVCYLTKVDIGSQIKTEGSKLALRFYTNLWDVDLSIISLFNKEESPLWGLNFACVLGDRLEIHGEASLQRGSYRAYHQAIREANTFYSVSPFTSCRAKDHKQYLQAVIGFQVTLPGDIQWIAEYFHQDQGYSKAEWSRMMNYLHFLGDYLPTPWEDEAMGNLLWCAGLFSPKGSMRDYMMHSFQNSAFKAFGLQVTALWNLQDRSCVFIPEIQYRAGNHFTFYGRSFIFHGHAGAEFGELFQSHLIEGGLRFQ